MLTNRDREVLRWLEDYKAITVCQATQMFFKGCYEGCRRRLKELEEYGVLKSYKTRLTDEKVYYIEDKLSDHDILRYNFLKEIKRLGGNILNLDTKPSYLKDKIRPDAYVEFEYQGEVYFILLEVDLTHYTSPLKMKKYEELYKSGELQSKCYGTFPIIIISRATKNDVRYNSRNFKVIYTDFGYKTLSRFLFYNY